MTENKRYSLGKTGCYRTKLIIDNENGNELGNSIVVKRLNELNDEKEFWKSMYCSQSNFNQILLNELDIAQEQGYEVSNPFKKLMEKKED